jgi:hypothetical protein
MLLGFGGDFLITCTGRSFRNSDSEKRRAEVSSAVLHQLETS